MITLTQGTSLWAIQQMLEGKKVKRKGWSETDYCCIIEGRAIDSHGSLYALGYFQTELLDWQLWTPLNPHNKGTFAWAWEEIQRGNKVKVYKESAVYVTYWLFEGGLRGKPVDELPGKCHFMPIEFINSTKWELAE